MTIASVPTEDIGEETVDDEPNVHIIQQDVHPNSAEFSHKVCYNDRDIQVSRK